MTLFYLRIMTYNCRWVELQTLSGAEAVCEAVATLAVQGLPRPWQCILGADEEGPATPIFGRRDSLVHV